MRHTDQQADGVIIGYELRKTRDPNYNAANPVTNNIFQTITYNVDNAGALTQASITPLPSRTSVGASKLAAEAATLTPPTPGTNSVMNNDNPLMRNSVEVQKLFPNQFNQTFRVANLTRGATTLPNFTGGGTADIVNQVTNPNPTLVSTLPNNVSRILIVVNNDQNSINAAQTQIATLQLALPNVQFALATDPGDQLTWGGGVPNTNVARVVFNPTQDFLNNRNITNFVIAFTGSLLPTAPNLNTLPQSPLPPNN